MKQLKLCIYVALLLILFKDKAEVDHLKKWLQVIMFLLMSVCLSSK